MGRFGMPGAFANWSKATLSGGEADAIRWLSLPRHIPMPGFDAVPLLTEALLNLLCNHDRAMLSPGTAKGNSQVTLALLNVVRKQEEQEIGGAVQKLPRLGKLPNIGCHLGMLARQSPELGNEMRIGKEADIENQIRL